MLDRLDETIVAVSSAPGRGHLGILRLTGPRAIEIVEAVASLTGCRRLSDAPGWTRSRGEVLLDADARVPADFLIFRAPRSYTRQDLIEIHTIGSPPLLELIRKRALQLGARPAQPGEFTARAFLNGRIDLASAEAVAGVIRARSDAQLRAARRMMDGTLADRLRDARDELGELLALVEADIDFAEEPIEFITPAELVNRLNKVRAQLFVLTDRGVSVERIENLPRILLLGPPNAGKSTLMNRLSGTDRAICAAVAGTTRDILAAPVQLGRIEAVLLDAAGIDASPDEIIAKARTLVLSEAERVDAVCIVLDVTAAPDAAFLEIVRSLEVPHRVIVANKCDVSCQATPAEVPSCAVPPAFQSAVQDTLGARGVAEVVPVLPISARTGEGVDALRVALADLLADQPTTTSVESVLLTERQHAALATFAESLARATSLAAGASQTIDSADVLAFELREALDALASVTGELTTEDLLTQVFSKFCIGK